MSERDERRPDGGDLDRARFLADRACIWTAADGGAEAARRRAAGRCVVCDGGGLDLSAAGLCRVDAAALWQHVRGEAPAVRRAFTRPDLAEGRYIVGPEWPRIEGS